MTYELYSSDWMFEERRYAIFVSNSDYICRISGFLYFSNFDTIITEFGKRKAVDVKCETYIGKDERFERICEFDVENFYTILAEYLI